MTNDKIAYVEALLYNYKKNKARVRILELGLISDEDFILGSIDYSSNKVQTSNLSSLDDKVIARQREMGKLKKDIVRVEEMLSILNGRYKTVVINYSLEGKTYEEILPLINRNDDKTVYNIKLRALKDMAKLA